MIRIAHLTKSYPGPRGEHPVLRELDLHVEAGQAVAVLGRSGSGKSTLLGLVGGLDRRYSGSIQVADTRLEQLSDRDLSRMRGRLLGFVFQTPVFLNHLTCLDNLVMAARFSRADASPSRLRAMLAGVGLEDCAPALPDDLSGGQRQRLALVRALVADPAVLLCDEPTGNLDDETGQTVIDHLLARREEGRTLLIVTHDRRIAEACTRRLRLADGRLAEVEA